MRHHAAKKIVKRITLDPPASLRYGHGQLRTAYRKAGLGGVPSDVWAARERAKLRVIDARLAEIERTVQKYEQKGLRKAEEAARILQVASKKDGSEQPNEATSPDYEAMTVPDLKALCKEREIKRYSSKTRAALIEMLTAE